PWESWLATLWQEALAAGTVPDDTRLRTPWQAVHAWNRIVAAEAMPLIDPQGAAGLAADAWALVHAWGAGGESWRAWRDTFEETDDVAIFVRGAEKYAGASRRADAADLAQAPERLARLAARSDRR